MKQSQLFLIAILFTGVSLQLKAQNNSELSEKDKTGTSKAKNVEQKQNLVKLNLTAIALKNYSIQYERIVKKKISFAVSMRTMPATTLPFKNKILNIVGDDPDTRKVIETFQLSNFAITPEVRFYLSKRGYGRGFYMAPFYRYASFKTSQLEFTYSDILNVENTINLSGKLTANTAGLMFGAQWPLGKNVSLDWWIFGPHYGSGTGNFSGVASQPLTQVEQDDLRKQLEDIDIPLTNKTVNVNSSGASMKLDGPWGGLRAGISLGVRF